MDVVNQNGCHGKRIIIIMKMLYRNKGLVSKLGLHIAIGKCNSETCPCDHLPVLGMED